MPGRRQTPQKRRSGKRLLDLWANGRPLGECTKPASRMDYVREVQHPTRRSCSAGSNADGVWRDESLIRQQLPGSVQRGESARAIDCNLDKSVLLQGPAVRLILRGHAAIPSTAETQSTFANLHGSFYIRQIASSISSSSVKQGQNRTESLLFLRNTVKTAVYSGQTSRSRQPTALYRSRCPGELLSYLRLPRNPRTCGEYRRKYQSRRPFQRQPQSSSCSLCTGHGHCRCCGHIPIFGRPQRSRFSLSRSVGLITTAVWNWAYP